MKNFEFLKDFDNDMYTLLSEFEREAVKIQKHQSHMLLLFWKR